MIQNFNIFNHQSGESGMTLAEILVVVGIILIIGTLAIPSIRQVKRRHFEDVAILKLKDSANAEKRYFSHFKRFGNYHELVDAGFLPPGYTTRLEYWLPITGASTRPFIEAYSVRFLVPQSPNSLFFKIVAYPVDESLGLNTYNINMFLNFEDRSDLIYQDPPIRKGYDDDGPPIGHI
ncbi:type II secretion system GspH family protein [bacterium]|nr:type II secretion system GspH family protein [bacterium]MBU1025431.1 type II secretion system GspH family protein [bacterium]